ncbi:MULTISPECIES: plasmid mobilization relaxosome protein MobC [Streptococcus]|uniref:plasmid mobilization relaxosome protein MobC n=1 Tax=Streptococcus TaxID=1301 RepID=UPI001EFA81E1|nr:MULTISPECIES: plasmid mobilization relaxosome protein MobC [Streptococcus]
MFEKKMKLTKCKTMSHFIRKSVLEGDIFVIDLQPFVDLQGLLYNATNNINQIAKRVNTTAVIYKDDIQTMKEKIDSLSKEIWQIHSLLFSRTHKAGEKQNGSH